MTNLFLSITLFTSTNGTFSRIDVSNTSPQHVYSLQSTNKLNPVCTNWEKSWIFNGSDNGVNKFYIYPDDTNRFYRVLDMGTNF